VRQKNQPAWLLLLGPAAENPRSTLLEQVSESAEILIRDPRSNRAAEMLTSKWNTLFIHLGARYFLLLHTAQSFTDLSPFGIILFLIIIS
jgi:hypothetical protein